ncbi:hypothetical protein W97_05049 [Coniosporium apollinis CBS 100218]|uniref:Uncharacterized protein n=1 Tax=Coniosporium apollinis (strain CBS 100218) TaxID=1168221 RepID=R7YV51_CONA1|nr:uncharacterized protein W97_05049 [Coniosporium apollinis CBS 100218]EON65810.1 hypothetical protein W97_05049 [Coniosporium apollinis CBS 100218]
MDFYERKISITDDLLADDTIRVKPPLRRAESLPNIRLCQPTRWVPPSGRTPVEGAEPPAARNSWFKITINHLRSILETPSWPGKPKILAKQEMAQNYRRRPPMLRVEERIAKAMRFLEEEDLAARTA